MKLNEEQLKALNIAMGKASSAMQKAIREWLEQLPKGFPIPAGAAKTPPIDRGWYDQMAAKTGVLNSVMATDLESAHNNVVGENVRLKKELAEARAMLDQYNDPTAYSTAVDYNKMAAECAEIRKRWDESRDLGQRQQREFHEERKKFFNENASLNKALIGANDIIKAMQEDRNHDTDKLVALQYEREGYNSASAKLNAEICGLREELNKAQILLAGADMERANMQARIDKLNEALANSSITIGDMVEEIKGYGQAMQSLKADNDRLINDNRNLRG